MKRPLSKILFFLLVFTYVFSSVGVCLVAHYCGGELEKISLFSKPTSCCGEEDEGPGDCCSNDSKHVAFQKDFTFHTFVSDCKAPVQQLFILNHTQLMWQLPATRHLLFLSHKQYHPPNLVQEDMVSLSVLRI